MPKKEDYKLVNYSDPLEEHNLKATNTEDAALEALDMLGYGICSKGLKVKEWVKLLKKVKKQKAGDKE
ncbi:unnamed protein product [marine sediment metagenome]|uniref:Uncharacterized protein n=1 Tax=marine sediment metagenome TaxID=412755 RepID=X1G3S8_9ZZZZ